MLSGTPDLNRGRNGMKHLGLVHQPDGGLLTQRVIRQLRASSSLWPFHQATKDGKSKIRLANAEKYLRKRMGR